MDRSRALLIALPALVAAVLAGGCDPKFPNGVEDNTHDAGGGGGSGTPQSVSPEAVITGAVVAFHTELLAGALSVAGDHDTGGAAPATRSFLSAGCLTITLVDAQAPVHAFDLDGCTDGNGTSYFGGGEFTPPIDATDGFLLVPDFSLERTIVSTNDTNSDLHQTVTAGSLKLAFSRNGTTATGLTVSNFLRHFIRDTPDVTFGYDGVTYTGGIGEMGPYPDAGGLIHVAWDGVAVFDVEFAGGPNASFRLQGQNYTVNLDTAEVKIATTL